MKKILLMLVIVCSLCLVLSSCGEVGVAAGYVLAKKEITEKYKETGKANFTTCRYVEIEKEDAPNEYYYAINCYVLKGSLSYNHVDYYSYVLGDKEVKESNGLEYEAKALLITTGVANGMIGNLEK